MAIVKNAVKAMESKMEKETIYNAHIEADRDILKIRLSELRERMHVRQSDVPSFTQSAISKLEKRKDMKLSTLIGYLEGIGMGLEIRVYPKKGKKGVEETLLRV